MRSSHISVVLATLLLGGVAGCADNDQLSAPPPASARATSAPVPSATATPAPADKVFPLTVTRRGGFAGVDDRAEITADGSAVVTVRGRPPVQTSLPAGTMTELRRLVTAPGFTDRATPSGTEPVCNDGYEYEVTTPSASISAQGCDAPPAQVAAIVAMVFKA